MSVVSNTVAKNTLYLTLAAIGQKIIAFVYFLVLARVLAPELTGEYFLATSIIIMFSVVADFGISPLLVREIAKEPKSTVTITRNAIALKVPLILLGMLGAVLTGGFLNYSAQVQGLILIGTIVLLLDALTVIFYGVLRGHQILKFESVGVFLAQSMTAIIGGLSLWLNPNLNIIMLALVGGSTVNAMVSGLMVAKRFGWKILLPKFEREGMKWLFVTALPFALAAIFVKVYSYIDSVFISKMLGSVAVGIYAVAYKLTYAFQFLPMAFSAALYPNLSELTKEDNPKLNETLMSAFWYMGLLSVPIVFGMSAIAEELVLLTGDGFTDAAPVLSVLVLVLLPIFLDFPVGALLNASGRQVTKTTIYGMTMLVNVALNLLFIPNYFVIGAAYAALGSFTFLFIAGMYFVPKIVNGFSWLEFCKTLLPIYLSGGVMYLTVVYLKPHIGWALVIPVGAVVYGLCLYLSGSLNIENIKKLRTV